jgi:hypothetical protein
MPITDGSVTSVHTRLRDGRPKKKFSEEEIHGQRKTQEQSLRPSGIKVLKKK